MFPRAWSRTGHVYEYSKNFSNKMNSDQIFMFIFDLDKIFMLRTPLWSPRLLPVSTFINLVKFDELLTENFVQ